MGLDNGLIIEPKTTKGEQYLATYFGHLFSKYSSEPEWEFFYSRKCWNIRSKFFEYGLAEGAGGHVLSIEDLPKVVDIMKYFLEEKNWREDGASIWEWHIVLPSIAECIYNIKELLEDIENGDISGDDLLITFYDSY